MADSAPAELQHDIVAEQIQQLVHLAGMDAARSNGHDLFQIGPVLLEEVATRQIDLVVRFSADIVVALDGQRVSLELADSGAAMQMIDPARRSHLAMTRNEMPWFFCRV